jgi:hypothetical protein
VVRVSLFVWLLPLDLTGNGGPTSSYATAGIALRVSGALKPHHHDKVEIPLVGTREGNTEYCNMSLTGHVLHIFIGLCILRGSTVLVKNID